MRDSTQSTAEISPVRCERTVQAELILKLINIGDKEAGLGRDAEATRTYYSIFQPELIGVTALGLHRVAPIELYVQAANKLRAVASRFAVKLVKSRCLLPGDSTSGIVGVPRGALNLYLISNQFDVFAEFALHYAAEEFGRRDIKRFLMSSVRARLSHLESVQRCATLLDEEQEVFPKLADFETRLHAHLAPLRQRQADEHTPCVSAPGPTDELRYA
ncbi:MAG: hypothetical protein WBN07_04760 [Woeseiaceae bacterium]